MIQESDYTPIDCNFYDRLEAWSVQKELVNIQLTDDDKPVQGLIIDLYIRNKVEFLKLDSEIEIRLDRIASVNDILLNGSCRI